MLKGFAKSIAKRCGDEMLGSSRRSRRDVPGPL
jgi:hypothetical protein